MNKAKEMTKYAVVGKHKTGYWEAIALHSMSRIGGLYDTEIEAIKVANAAGYVVG
jgi:hypothetical protein